MLGKKIITIALFIGSLVSAAASPSVVADEKAAGEAEGWATYEPAVLEAFAVDNYQTALNGISLSQWTALPGANTGTVIGNVISGNTAAPMVLGSNAVYPLPLYGTWQLQAAMSFAASNPTGTITSPFGYAQDPFYGQGFFGGVDLTDGWNLGFALTNTKIYAVYARLPTSQTIINNYFSFVYYVPIAQRSSSIVNTLGLVINKQQNTVSWRADGFELLRITRPGQAIADKFRVGDFGGAVADVGLPSSLQIAIGVMRAQANGVPHSACQNAIFQACAENIDCAFRTLCQYANIQTAPPYGLDYTAAFNYISVIEQVPVLTCYDQAKCPQVSSSCSCDTARPCCTSSSDWPSSCSSTNSTICQPCPPCPIYPCCSSSSSSCSSSSSSSSCSSSSSSSSSSTFCPPHFSSSSSSSSVCPPARGPEPINCSSSSNNCECKPDSSSSHSGFICVPRESSSSSSNDCEESSRQCQQRREVLRARGFIFPF